MKKLELNKESFEIVTKDELELVGGAKNRTYTTPACETQQADCCNTDCDISCDESYCYCNS